MNIPKIGAIINNKTAISLCQHYQFDKITERIKANPEGFKEWKFDGASMLPDEIVSRIINLEQETFSEVALKHDLKYAYGVPGDQAAKDRADKEFEQDLLQIEVPLVFAKMMYLAVAHFGGEQWDTTFSWGFANK